MQNTNVPPLLTVDSISEVDFPVHLGLSNKNWGVDDLSSISSSFLKKRFPSASLYDIRGFLILRRWNTGNKRTHIRFNAVNGSKVPSATLLNWLPDRDLQREKEGNT